MPLKIYGHPWSIHTRKALLTLAEKGREAELVTVLLPKGEHKEAAHLARHPFAKVPVLDDDGFVLYESTAIMRYLDRKLGGPSLLPADPREAARVEQWIHVADAYFAPHAGAFLVETLFRRYLGGEPNTALIASSREAMAHPLDVADARLAETPYFAGGSFTLADIHWMPYLEYLVKTGHAELVTGRPHLAKWWDAVSRRDTWQKVGRTGPQPYES
jgi:glutathione S-transferase